jgi:hypothetical protein
MQTNRAPHSFIFLELTWESDSEALAAFRNW